MTVPDLGSYTKPPVVEVVAAVRFDDLPPQLSLGLAEFWRDRLQAEMPDFSVQPPYQAPVETFDSQARVPEFTLDITSASPPARMWFSSASGDELVQLQPNWLACNWRKVTPEAQYGRWGNRRQAFIDYYQALSAWIDERAASLQPNQCEVTYINHIYPMEGVWSTHADLHHVVRGAARGEAIPHVEQEQSDWRIQYRFTGPDGQRGRLHVKATPAFNIKDDQPIFVMELTARGAPTAPTLEGVMEFLDHARVVVVTMFNFATTVEAQREWGKR